MPLLLAIAFLIIVPALLLRVGISLAVAKRRRRQVRSARA